MLLPREEEDLERCVALLVEVYRVDRYPAIWPPDAVGWLGGRDALAAWVAEEAEHLLGHLSLHATDDSRARPEWGEALGVGVERLAVVSRFFVSPEARGRGIGAALIARAERHAAGRVAASSSTWRPTTGTRSRSTSVAAGSAWGRPSCR